MKADEPRDPLVSYDSEGNVAPIAQFPGDFTAYQAAWYFASQHSRPEPRSAGRLLGGWNDTGYIGTFRLAGGKRTYLMTCDKKYASWRVYMLPKGHDLEVRHHDAARAKSS